MKRTERGFAVYTQFKDFYGGDVRVQESSLASRRCCWIFPEVKMHLGEPQSGAHLTVAMAKRVIKALQAFVDGSE